MHIYASIWKITADQGDDYTTGCLLYYNHFKNYYRMIAIDLSKQQALDDDLKSVQHIIFSGNFDQAKGATMFFINEEVKETILDFSQGTVEVL